jgi:hypothetical protein
MLKKKIPLTGLEPVLSALRGRRVNQLHYSGKLSKAHRLSVTSDDDYTHLAGLSQSIVSFENKRLLKIQSLYKNA